MKPVDQDMIDQIKVALTTIDEKDRTARGIALHLLGDNSSTPYPVYFRKLARVCYYLKRQELTSSNSGGIFVRKKVGNAYVWSVKNVYKPSCVSIHNQP